MREGGSDAVASSLSSVIEEDAVSYSKLLHQRNELIGEDIEGKEVEMGSESGWRSKFKSRKTGYACCGLARTPGYS
jgi:hypothetical protein